MRKTITLLAASAALAVSAPASAADLLNLTNTTQNATPQSFTFTATGASTVLNFQGYNLPGSTAIVNLFFGTSGSTPTTANNLLVGAAYTPTASGCGNYFGVDSNTAAQSFGAAGLYFGGTCAGIYDTLTTSLNTTVGQAYTLRFDLSVFGGINNGVRVSTGALTTGAVPEPATWAMMLIGFGGIGFAMRRQRKAALLAA
jgi:hypothetical protein